jgi:hypothetical protein
MYSDACESGVLAEEQFKKKYKNVTGMHPSDHYYNWVYNSSCPELELSYEFNKRNYSLDLTLKQTSAVQYDQTYHQNLH